METDMKIADIFLKPVSRDIEGVIKADDIAHIRTEVEEYVLTNEIARNLENLLSQYNQTQTRNTGVWISGFFGSGKSHLLKIVSLLLENHTQEDFSVFDTFIEKVPAQNTFLRADLKKALAFPSKSILFNIDQKAPSNTDDSDVLLEVFVNVFDDFCGYYGRQAYVANFERELDKQKLFGTFKENFFKLTGQNWEKARESFNIHREKISLAFAQTTGNPEDSSKDIIESYRKDYQISIEGFAENVNDYLQTQDPNFRLNFFVDEVGQFIAENMTLMLNLQTISETLATKCNGRSWLFVTSQEDMSSMFGDLDHKLGNDFSKIMARFQTKIHLSSQDVAEVIQKRLLEKNEQGRIETRALYGIENKNFGTLFTFPDGGKAYRNFRGEDDFIASYPFVPYQYTLFQEAIRSLSKQNAFMGRHSSVGERSMLGVFQEVARTIEDKPMGTLGSFDLMFAGISNAIKASNQSAILNAENHLEDPFARKLLKTLFLVKYVEGFKSTPRNLRVLMQSSFTEDIQELEMKVRNALALLENRTYIQRNGDVFEYLTSEEQDIENAIKSIIIDTDELHKAYEELFFARVIKDPKLKYAKNNQDYSFTKSIDNRTRGKEHELLIDFITPSSDLVENLSLLKSHTLGKPNLLVVLPDDERFAQDVAMYIKTEVYLKQQHMSSASETRSMILNKKGAQNAAIRNGFLDKANRLVKDARFIISGEEIEINSEDAKTRIFQAFNALIERVYPNLRMLGSRTYTETDISTILKKSAEPLFQSEEAHLTEAALELMIFIRNSQTRGEKTTMKNVEDQFSRRPYGWYLAAIQCITAELVAQNKIEAWQNGNLLEGAPLEAALKNTYNFGTLIFQPVDELNPRIIKGLQGFHHRFFDKPTNESNAKKLIKSIKEEAYSLLDEIKGLLRSTDKYPFLVNLNEAKQRVLFLAEKDTSYYTETLLNERETWLELKENEIDPIMRFMAGDQVKIYDEIAVFLDQMRLELSNEESQALDDMLRNPKIYQNSQLVYAKKKMDQLKLELDKKVQARKEWAYQTATQRQDQLRDMAKYQALDEAERARFDAYFDDLREKLERCNLTIEIKQMMSRFEEIEFPGILNELDRLQSPIESDHPKPPSGISQNIQYININRIPVPIKKYTLETEEDVKEYCQMMERVLLEKLQDNNHIIL